MEQGNEASSSRQSAPKEFSSTQKVGEIEHECELRRTRSQGFPSLIDENIIMECKRHGWSGKRGLITETFE
ncbi:hypothetical protein Sjap_003295 [Stephania japonica]|uniref:Uncharacterized protein n=1 Tax=Stephania japonica TaxID=461633 RepID=A0AAP0PUX7_9MAGN